MSVFRFQILDKVRGRRFEVLAAVVIALSSYLLPQISFSQNPNACDMPGGKKVEKLWEQALNERKPSVRRELYKEILNSEEDHHGAVFAKAYSN